MRPPSPKTFVVEREGEMPEGVPSFPQKDILPSHDEGLPKSIPTALPRFTPYEVPDDIPRSSTPDPIKVARPKKKGASAKKKRAQNPGDESSVL
jgi:AP-3 complex subunit delta-1